MSYGQPCSRTTAVPSTGPLSRYPTFRGPASIWLTAPNPVSGSVVTDTSPSDRHARHRGHGIEDHVRHGLRLRDHDHVRPVELRDLGAGALRHRTGDVGSGCSVGGGDNGP